jgi:hypothetical protein
VFTHRVSIFYLFPIAWLILVGFFAGIFPCIVKGDGIFPPHFVLDMVQDNPGEPQQPSAFRDPHRLADWGYNGQVIEGGADSCETFDAIAPDILPKGSEARTWIEQHAQALELKAQLAHAAGIKAYAWFQFIVLPKALVAKFKSDICDERGRIDLERPMTQKILRAQIAELFERCPDLDGLVVRTGEIYLQDSPFHAASANTNESKTQSSTAIIHGPDSHIALLKILRDATCVQRNKMVIYRTWDFGNNFHVNPEYYLKVTDAIEPHPNLIFSIKHQAGDFLRMTPFNPTLGIGKHRQIVEVQCQREAYGKGAHPFYVGDGVINGWEEYATLMKPGQPEGLRDIVNNTNFAGVWTWSRGGGWEGPYITNELWCALNAYVIAKYAENPKRTEEEIFNEFATQQLGLKDGDIARFRELNLLSAAAVLRGQCSLIKRVDLWWARDDFMAAPNLSVFSTTNLISSALAEKAEAVADWKKIESLARQIHFADPAMQDFVETSCAYGRIKHSIFEQGWTILLYGVTGDSTKKYDCEKLSAAIASYDALWQEWRALKTTHPSCATIYQEVTFGGKPGIGAAVDRYRKICATGKKIRVLIVDGFSNHDWQQTTALIRGVLAPSGLFEVAVSTAPGNTNDVAWTSWRPKFSDYDVVIQTCNDISKGPPWPEPVKKDFEDFVWNGGGVYIFHSAENAFVGWKEYEQMVGLCWRKADYGTSIRVNEDGSLVRIPPGEGGNTSHGQRGDVLITRLGDDPIHAGMPRQWLTPGLEVYYYARGPATNVTVLAYARDSKPGQGLLWPVEWTVSYGKGRVYVSTYGHVWKGDVQPASMRCAAVQTLISRTIQWLAGKPVTIPMPPDFPGTNAVSIRPEIRLPSESSK